MRFVIINGKWVHTNGEPINAIDLNKLPSHIENLSKFAGDKRLSHTKITLLSRILESDLEHDEAILKVLDMNKQDLFKLI